MHLQVSTDTVGTTMVVRAVGELDLHTAGELSDELTKAVDAREALVVVDLTQVDFMDSTGLSTIVATVAGMRSYDGELRVVTATEKITKLFTLTGVDQRVGLFSSVAEATL